ncbi:hypothetical protein O181_000111 [Austropuccinia psidii MF-1]|uniref:Uncharacterized protein n=1 Tax=Austropuccinia psidii MF-1 TaxID=1389203 RepID=A0A9Q3B7Y9_9BASI|nr:hypothetical protein [Austropuccinia psidii MF-1]
MSYPFNNNETFYSSLPYPGLGHPNQNTIINTTRALRSNIPYILPPIIQHTYIQHMPSSHIHSTSQTYNQMAPLGIMEARHTYRNWQDEDTRAIGTNPSPPSQEISVSQQRSSYIPLSHGSFNTSENTTTQDNSSGQPDVVTICNNSQGTRKRKNSKVIPVDITAKKKYKSNKTSHSEKNPPFTDSDFEHVCNYLEEEGNYNDLFGDSKKTHWTKQKHTRIQAFGQFAKYLNLHHTKGTLHLDAQKLQQRWQTYKRKYVITSRYAHSKGAGTSHNNGLTLDKELDLQCPCFKRMDAIFGKKSNVRATNVKDTSKQIEGKDQERSSSEWDEKSGSMVDSNKEDLLTGDEKGQKMQQVQAEGGSSDLEVVLIQPDSKFNFPSSNVKSWRIGPKGSLPVKTLKKQDKAVLGTLEKSLMTKYWQLAGQLKYNQECDEKQSKLILERDERQQQFTREQEER